jgi:hypothetical protein
VPSKNPWLYFKSQPISPETKKSNPPNPTEKTRWYCQPGRPGHERLCCVFARMTTAIIKPIKAISW